jgi:hypothetical protein
MSDAMPPPPAPFLGPDLEGTQRLLTSGDPELPIILGVCVPTALIDRAEGGYVLRRLVENPEAADRIARERTAEGYFMPEHLFEAREPGEVLARAATLPELAAQLPAVWSHEIGRRAPRRRAP